ncbi:universal stress protein [Nocardia carnea]|uniref:Universal stress protein n=1 Tax=Nocardia carnea TaxID=37328 RepID=A0ABW7THM3_9NOCA|nr:universal stress protein [Nocardia carnea]
MVTHRPDRPHNLASAAVVVGTDGSAASHRAVRWAAETAAQRGRTLHIVHGLDLTAAAAALGSFDLLAPGITDNIRRRGAEYITSATHLARSVAPGVQIRPEVCEAEPARLLIARSADAHMVVLGAAGDSGTFTHLGSTLLAVVAHGRGSIAVVRHRGTELQPGGGYPVVVGIDGSPRSQSALAAAFHEAAERKSRLVAVHAWCDQRFDRFAGYPNTITDPVVATAAQTLLSEQLAGWQEKYPDVPVIRKVYPAGPVHQLIGWSRLAQLVVVGNRGRGGFRGLLLGSTGNALVQHAHCPVMVTHTEQHR